MTEKLETGSGRRRRRSTEEIQQLVEEFARSGMKPREFCQVREFALSTLQRHLQRKAEQTGKTKGRSRLVRVEIDSQRSQKPTGECGLAVVLSSGRRIEVGPGFDATTLERLLTMLERW